jgi:peroxiredoxin
MNQNIGQRFPDFELTDHDSQVVKLSQAVGKFPLILTFYRGYW